MSDYSEWMGRRRSSESLLDPWPRAALEATLGFGAPAETGCLPMLWHWLYFLETPLPDQLGRDGHARTGEFFPPMAQPRRMFVGARTRCETPLQTGQPASVTETIVRCEDKTGSSGVMTLLTVGYEYHQHGSLCLSEERDFMYLGDRVGAAVEARVSEEVTVPEAPLSADVETDPVLLFKFSALTFNGHRIHYDGDYARDIEGYPERVVHGPLTALLLAGLAASGAGPLSGFSFRARAPLFVGDRLRLRGEVADDSVDLKAYRPDGRVAMTAEAQLC